MHFPPCATSLLPSFVHQQDCVCLVLVRQETRRGRSFGYIVRDLYHEFIHIDQILGLHGPEMKGEALHNEREFLAYYKSLTNTTLPAYNLNSQITYINIAISNKVTDQFGRSFGNYYHKLTKEKQAQYLYEYNILQKMINKLKSKK